MNRIAPTRRHVLAASAAMLAARLPHPGRAQDVGQTGDDDGSLPSMLARAYDPVPDGGEGPTTLLAYGNLARQLEVRGLRAPDPGFQDRDRTSEWIDGVDGLALDDVILQHALLEKFWALLGFDPTQVDQTLTVGDVPGITRIYRGRFDGRTIERALEGTGYERVETDDGPIWTIGRDAEMALTHPIQAVVLNALNNIAVVGDGHIVASPFIIGVQTTLAVMAGNEATLANNVAVATLLDAVDEELVAAIVLDGSFLSAANLPGFVEGAASTPVPEETIPTAPYALFGLTPGSMPSRYTDEDDQLQGDNDDTAPRSVVVMAVHLGSEEEAAAAAPVIERRLATSRSALTGEPYATFFEGWEVAGVPGTPVVKIRISGDRIVRRWLQLVYAQDIVFLYTV